MKRVLLLLFIGVCFFLYVSGHGCIDEEGDEKTIYYLTLDDADGDGHFALGSRKTPNDDCNDFDPYIHPGATEFMCDHIDQNCDGMADDDADTDGDLVSYCEGDCDDGDSTSFPGALEVICNGTDNNCNGMDDEAPDWDRDGNDVCDFSDPYNPDGAGADCHDFNLDVHMGMSDLCDETDNDCDGVIDEDCVMYAEMVMIPVGCFEMGDAFIEGQLNEFPVHKVCVTERFYMDVHEVTNADYAVCVDRGGCAAPSNVGSSTRGSYYDNPLYNVFPVINVNWAQAAAYCAWAGKRLPTEAEWEYAARGGLDGKRYPWGDDISGTDANYSNSGDLWDNDTSPKELYAPNSYGLYDMSGNAWEWVNDYYLQNYYATSPIDDPAGPAAGAYRVIRGGGWNATAYMLRVAYRGFYDPTASANILGFRCVKD